MRKNKHLASTIAAAVAVAMLGGASAFAESRPSEETRRRGDVGDRIRRERSAERPRGDESRNDDRQRGENRTDRTWRGESRRSEPRADTYRREPRREEGRRAQPRAEERRAEPRRDGRFDRDDSYREQHRSDSRYGRRDGYSYRGGDRRYDRREPYYYRGPVTSYRRHGNGYHVWLRGARYPFFVPHSHWHRDRFRIGVVIGLGGYYNPGGYYDYYDGYSYRSTSRGELRGTVESVDYRRDTFVLRNDATGSFVTVVSRDRGARDLRPGDYVELQGTWTRGGLFSAYDVDLLDYGYRDRW